MMLCRSSVCPFVCDVCVLLSYSFEFFENNYQKISPESLLAVGNKTPICSTGNQPEIPGGIRGGEINTRHRAVSLRQHRFLVLFQLYHDFFIVVS